jgi:alkylation response protein AidB-like acyl-CoA dehydrogenase
MFERMGILVGRGSMLHAAKQLVSDDRRQIDHWTRNWINGRVLSFTALRQLTTLSKGGVPGPEGSLGKLVGTMILSDLYEQAVENLGAQGLLAGGDAPYAGEWQDAFLGTPGLRIGGGTDQIQRNIIAERVLGLPKDPT